MGLKLLITGSSGFVGSNLSVYLKQLKLYKIVAFKRKEIKIDLTNIDIIIHLAGKAHDLKNISQPKDYYEANYVLSKKLFDAFLISSANVFIFMSSVKAAADEVDYILFEDTEAKPKTHYGMSKRQAELYILSKKIPPGKRVYILRPCMIHGPGNKGNLNLLYKLVNKGLPWPLGRFNNLRSFLSIENLCFVIKELLKNETISSGIYNIADNQPLSTNNLIQIIGQSLGKNPKVLNISTSIVQKIAKLGDSLNLPINTEKLQKLTDNYVVSNEKIIAAIGELLPVTSEEGLLRTFKSFDIKN